MKLKNAFFQDKEKFTKISPPCPYFGVCGGCALQDISYEDQLSFKKNKILQAISDIDPSLEVEVIGMEDPWRYRNRAELTFGNASASASRGSDLGIVLGYHASGSFWKLVDIEDCLLLPKSMSGIISDIRRLANETHLPAYNPKTHSGFFRYLLMRQSQIRGAILLTLITTNGNRSVVESMTDHLISRHPLIKSFYWGVNDKVADISFPDELFLIKGEEYLEDKIGSFSIRLHPFNFLQPNIIQAQKVYENLREWADEIPSGKAWDLYCGMGLVGFYLSSKYSKVYAIDVDLKNIELAGLNAKNNNIANIEFHLGRTEDILSNRRFWLNEAKPDLVAVDPPRAGLHQNVVSSLLSARPRQILYLSCNANSLVNDLRQLTNSFPRYKLTKIVSFDLFPHTPHLEVLTSLVRN